MNAAGALQRLRGRLGQSHVPDLARAYQIGQRLHRLLDRHLGVYPVQVVQVDVVDAEALQAAFDRLARVLRAAVEDARGRIVGIPHNAEFSRQHDLAAPAADRASDQLLVGERAVGVRRVQEIEPQVERAMDRRDRLDLVARTIEVAHPHATQPDRGYARAGGAESASRECHLFAPIGCNPRLRSAGAPVQRPVVARLTRLSGPARAGRAG